MATLDCPSIFAPYMIGFAAACILQGLIFLQCVYYFGLNQGVRGFRGQKAVVSAITIVGI